MSPAIGKSTKIRHIVRVRQMLCRWRARASRRLISPDVPAGHVAICVGTTRRRFVVRATYLNHPIFQKLLVEAEEEYGFCHKGTLTIPCEESEFEDVLRFISRPDLMNASSKSVRFCYFDNVAESKPLLRGSVY